MKLVNTGWAFAVCNDKSGIVPLNYLVLMKKINPVQNSAPKIFQEIPVQKNIKRVSFGENQIFESTDPPRFKIPEFNVDNKTDSGKSDEICLENSRQKINSVTEKNCEDTLDKKMNNEEIGKQLNEVKKEEVK